MYDLPGAYVRDLVEVVARWGVAADALLAGLPVTGDALADPATRVSLRVCEAIVARAQELTGERGLGVHLGMQMRVSSHGFLGFAAMTAGTVREALELAVRFQSTRTSAIGLALHVEGELASVAIAERAPLGALREVLVLALVIGLWQLGERLTGRALDGAGECAFPEPPYLRGLPHAGRLRFGCPAHRLVFSAAELALPLVTADAAATRLASSQLERELAAASSPAIVERVRAALDGGAAPLAEVARRLKLSPRTLKRRLAEHGTTFTSLRDDLRRQRALLLLANRSLSITDIAARLGYTELPNFTRAFRRWTGTTPASHRDGLKLAQL